MTLDNNSLNDFLFSRFKNGDELAFEHIFKSKFNQIIGFCDQFISDHDDAKNITQEAFINLWLNRNKIEKPSGINSFLYTFAKSNCLNFIRHQAVEEKYTDHALHEKEQLLNAEVLESFDFNSLEFIELEELIQKSISNLPEKCREVFIKKRFEGKMNKEIAEDLGINIKSVEANMTRAIKALKKNLSEYLPAILVQLIVQYLN
ncbi:RNA polymerase sigma-70 factor [Prolixibacteraceae bacterium Z1-6]|uniref:RNA polymerase sigma-70 factor n=1 Tax=Draconibacterium aestuarii TaxID=2998507 RepID=A0A9X3J900_9BACT|nr:RNA polymerase sigma-70 factor [Prolixibacteraceae bacterium Z1-6]